MISTNYNRIEAKNPIEKLFAFFKHYEFLLDKCSERHVTFNIYDQSLYVEYYGELVQEGYIILSFLHDDEATVCLTDKGEDMYALYKL